MKNKKYIVYQINGVDDPIHVAVSLHPSVSLSSLVKDINVSSSKWMKENKVFEHFKSWQAGYGAFTYSINEKQNLINYIFHQETHHMKKSYREEYIHLLEDHGIAYDDKYLF